MKKIYDLIFKHRALKNISFLLFFLGNIIIVKAQNPCPNTAAPNLITNGDFESCVIGNQTNDGFTTGYIYTGLTTCPGGEGGYNTTGQWTVTKNANALNSAYTNPTGTPGTGTPTPNHYLLVNVDGTANDPTYSTTVTVVPGATYFFSAWMADINSTFYEPPILKFSINGTQVGALVNVDPNANSNGWEQFFVTWTAPIGVTNPVAITIENERLVGSGNDLALDNISFSTNCSSISELSSIGQTASLIDTLYECDFSFPQTVTSGLPTSG